MSEFIDNGLVFCFPHPDPFKDVAQGAESRKSELQQVGADQGGEPEPVFTHEKRAGLNCQGKAQQDKKTGNCMNPVGDNHVPLLFDISYRITAWPLVKFISPLLPEEAFVIRLTGATPGTARFTLHVDVRLVASGQLTFTFDA